MNQIGTAAAATPAVFLQIEGLSKSFGGLKAVDDVSLSFERGRLHAVIGPNGAGKTTFFNLISGLIRADAGSAKFGDTELVGLAAHKIAQAGVVRTLQVKSVFNGLTVRQNIQVAAQAKVAYLDVSHSYGRDREVLRRVDRIIDEMKLGAIAHQTAGTLSYGDVALLEISMALALEPKLLLLDEPICGMSPAETARSVEKIVDLAKRIDVILIEHDMDVVFEIADVVTVLAQGRVLARGSSAAIASDAAVREAYLGPDE